VRWLPDHNYPPLPRLRQRFPPAVPDANPHRVVRPLGRLEPAATIAGFAIDPFTSAALPEITTTITHLREVLGDQTYESLARRGETMTTAAMVTYAYDQID
jgi:hypothetical protein